MVFKVYDIKLYYIIIIIVYYIVTIVYDISISIHVVYYRL